MNIKTIVDHIVRYGIGSSIYAHQFNDPSVTLWKYSLRKNGDYLELPLGVSSLRVGDNSRDLFIHEDTSTYIPILPKTALSILNNVLGRRGSITKWKASNHGAVTMKSVFGLITDQNNVPIMEFTSVFNIVAHRTEKYNLRISKDFILTDSTLAKYIKGSVVKCFLTESLNDLPVDIIITSDFPSPLRLPTEALPTEEEHRTEVTRILTTHAQDILNEMLEE